MTTFDELLLQVKAQDSVEQRIKLICDNPTLVTTTGQLLELIDQIPDGAPGVGYPTINKIVNCFLDGGAYSTLIADGAQLVRVIKKIHRNNTNDQFWLIKRHAAKIQSVAEVIEICRYLPARYTVFQGHSMMRHFVKLVGNDGATVGWLYKIFSRAISKSDRLSSPDQTREFFNILYSQICTANQFESVACGLTSQEEVERFMSWCFRRTHTAKDVSYMVKILDQLDSATYPDHCKEMRWKSLEDFLPICFKQAVDLETLTILLRSPRISHAASRACVIAKAAETIKDFDDLQNLLSKLVEPFLSELKAELINAVAKVITTKEECLAIRKLAVGMLAPLAPGDLQKIWEKLPPSVRPHQEEIAEARGVLVKGYDPDAGMELHVRSATSITITSPSTVHRPGLFSPPPRTGAAAGGAGASGPAPIPVSVHAETTETGYDPMYGT